MTRAKEKLSISLARNRRYYNRVTRPSPSRFLQEIPEKFLSLSFKPYRDERLSISDDVYLESEENEFSPGTSVYHLTFGTGVVTDVDESFGNRRVIVNFNDYGFRKIRPSQLQIRKKSYL